MSQSHHVPWTLATSDLFTDSEVPRFLDYHKNGDFTVCSIYTQASSSMAMHCEDHPYLAPEATAPALSLSIVLLYGCIRGCLSIHPLKDTLLAPVFYD